MSGITIDLENRPIPKPAMFADNRARAVKRMGVSDGAVLIFGLPEPTRPLCDFEPVFRQESCFYWLTGVNEQDCAIYIDIATCKATLFYPDLPAELAIWMGPLPTPADLEEKYGCSVRLIPTLDSFIKEQNPTKLYSLEPTFLAGLVKETKVPLDFEVAFKAIGEERQLKSEAELELIRYACNVNCDAFWHMIHQAKVGIWAQEVEAMLQHKYISAWCKYLAFQFVVGTGKMCATLHYHNNPNKLLDGDMVLVDSGCEYFLYASDNTRTFPANGKFSEDQKLVYQAVLDTQKAVIAAAKPGVAWPDMSRLSAKVMAEGLLKAGLFQNGTAEEIVESGAMAVFYPHGIGHGMGLECHEIVGWEPGHDRPDENHVRCLRMGRILVPGIIVTAEPGCYFVPALYEKAFEDPKTSKYINKEVCLRFRETVGGVRIEDNILITADGNENLTHIPKEIADIEALMAHK